MDPLDGFLRFLATGDTPDGLFTAGATLDMNVPAWRFEVTGVDGLRQARLASGGPWDVHAGPVTTTSDGFVVETSYDSVEDGVPIYTRSISVVTVDGGRISRMVHYCTGPWDPATRARHGGV